MHVKDYMQMITMTISPNDRISTARRMMGELFIRHLPVVVEGHYLVGILTDRDVRQASPSSGVHTGDGKDHDESDTTTVTEVMTRRVYTASPDTPLIEAASALLEKKFDCLPVIDEDGILTGLITVSDFVRVYVEQHENVIV